MTENTQLSIPPWGIVTLEVQALRECVGAVSDGLIPAGILDMAVAANIRLAGAGGREDEVL